METIKFAKMVLSLIGGPEKLIDYYIEMLSVFLTDEEVTGLSLQPENRTHGELCVLASVFSVTIVRMSEGEIIEVGNTYQIEELFKMIQDGKNEGSEGPQTPETEEGQAEPEEPEQPGKPEQPEEPGKPEEPEQPEKPEKQKGEQKEPGRNTFNHPERRKSNRGRR